MYQTKIGEKITTYSLSYNFFPQKIRAVYEIMWNNMVQPDRPQMIVWRMRFACWLPNATDTL